MVINPKKYKSLKVVNNDRRSSILGKDLNTSYKYSKGGSSDESSATLNASSGNVTFNPQKYNTREQQQDNKEKGNVDFYRTYSTKYTTDYNRDKLTDNPRETSSYQSTSTTNTKNNNNRETESRTTSFKYVTDNDREKDKERDRDRETESRTTPFKYVTVNDREKDRERERDRERDSEKDRGKEREQRERELDYSKSMSNLNQPRSYYDRPKEGSSSAGQYSTKGISERKPEDYSRTTKYDYRDNREEKLSGKYTSKDTYNGYKPKEESTSDRRTVGPNENDNSRDMPFDYGRNKYQSEKRMYHRDSKQNKSFSGQVVDSKKGKNCYLFRL
jgi:hypothetical protein